MWPAVWPDGAVVALKIDASQSDICVMESDGTSLTNLTTGLAGKQIAPIGNSQGIGRGTGLLSSAQWYRGRRDS